VRQNFSNIVRFVPCALLFLVIACGGEKPAAPAAPAAAGAPPAAETPGTSLAAAKPPFGFLHKPQEGETVHAGDWAFGWALSESGIAQVTAAVDTGATSPVALGADFPGVAKSYPKYPNADKAGFGFPIPKVDPGLHTLTIMLIGKNGGRTEIRRMVRVS
jgi:hypothetical protein